MVYGVQCIKDGNYQMTHPYLMYIEAHLLIIFIPLLESVCLCPKVILKNGFDCILIFGTGVLNHSHRGQIYGGMGAGVKGRIPLLGEVICGSIRLGR